MQSYPGTRVPIRCEWCKTTKNVNSFINKGTVNEWLCDDCFAAAKKQKVKGIDGE